MCESYEVSQGVQLGDSYRGFSGERKQPFTRTGSNPVLTTKINNMKLPTDYTKLTQPQRREVRIQYIKEQNNLCMYCGESLDETAPAIITSKPINWRLFPDGFLQHPIHLQHCHKTNMTEGAVHSYCNAVLWQYEGR